MIGQLCCVLFGFPLMPGIDCTHWFVVVDGKNMLLIFLLCIESDKGYSLNHSAALPT